MRSWPLVFQCVICIVTVLSCGCATMERLQSSGVLTCSDDGKPRINLLAVRQADATDCGVACLSSVLNYWGFPVPQDAIKSDLGRPPRDGYTLAQLRDYALRHGFAAFVMQGSYDILQKQCELGRPCIIVIKKGRKTNHSLVIVEMLSDGEDRWLLGMDPASGEVEAFLVSDINSRWEARGCPMLLVGRKEGDQ